MELRVLRYFLTVAREETMIRAAEVLHITQPTLGRQLSQLEYDLGVKLFEHQGRRVVLTADGLLLRRRAEEILELVDKTEQELSHQEDTIEGTVTVGYGEIGAMFPLADCIKAFSASYPQVRVSLFCGAGDAVKDGMDRGIVDVGLMAEPISIEKYNYIRINYVDRQAVFMRADDPMAAKDAIAPEDLAGKPLILPHRYQNSLRNWFGPYFQEENVRYISNLPPMGALLVESGDAYMIAIHDCLSFRDERRIVARPLAGGAEYHSVLAWKRGQPFGRAAEKFIEYAKCFLGKDQTA